MKKAPFKIVSSYGRVIECMNYKQMRKFLKNYLQYYEFTYPFTKPIITIEVLYNNKYVEYKTYQYYVCICVGNCNTNLKRCRIYTTSKDKALDNAYKKYINEYGVSPLYIISEFCYE